MNWESWDAFWHMGGHGRFVWGAFGSAALLMLGEAWLVARRLRRAKRDVKMEVAE